ncbi:HEAT repeat domain-containing protein [Paucibacter sp. DJ1R-11]|uniref:HEAT repeat domain-containing protein n=1 Tax=Paucibacter sp. DJ1R-11 TaxID=2893556 RepID=UPI0021E3B883|nr:HEAT repeat domain-containing protein [Paucibacter sp. DJ1R-11]MCV2361987.1 HEAT repeat domain-containing protein [Paucibacter sp. DJ1R-11]
MPLVKRTPNERDGICERSDARDCPSLTRQLDDGSAEARRWAARDLLNCPNCSTDLLARLNEEGDGSVREVILTTLTRVGDAQAVAGLVTCLRSEDVALRNEAIEAMKQLPDEVAPIMQDLLHDTSSDMRIFAVNILESLRHPQVEAWLCEVITQDAHVNVCGAAVDLLSELGSPAALQPLVQLKRRFPDDPYIQFAADLAINRLNDD